MTIVSIVKPFSMEKIMTHWRSLISSQTQPQLINKLFCIINKIKRVD